jgi:hypothetical protein
VGLWNKPTYGCVPVVSGLRAFSERKGSLYDHGQTTTAAGKARLCGCLRKVYAAAVVEALRPQVEAIVDRMLEPLLQSSEAELMQAVAYPLPMRELVTGGTSAIGATTVRRMSQLGANVLFTGCQFERANSIIRETERNSGKVVFFSADLSVPEEFKKIVPAAVEYGQFGICVNAVSAGAIRTPLVRDAVGSEEAVDSLSASHPLLRIGTPEEVAEAAAWLFSDSSSYVTGQSLVLDGGLTAQRPAVVSTVVAPAGAQDNYEFGRSGAAGSNSGA